MDEDAIKSLAERVSSISVEQKQEFYLDEPDYPVCLITVDNSLGYTEVSYSTVVDLYGGSSAEVVAMVISEANKHSYAGKYHIVKYNDNFVCTYTQTVVGSLSVRRQSKSIAGLLYSGLTCLKAVLYDISKISEKTAR